MFQKFSFSRGVRICLRVYRFLEKNVFTGKLTLCQQPVSYQNFDTRYAKANTRHEHLQAFTNDKTYGLNIILVFSQTCMV